MVSIYLIIEDVICSYKQKVIFKKAKKIPVDIISTGIFLSIIILCLRIFNLFY